MISSREMAYQVPCLRTHLLSGSWLYVLYYFILFLLILEVLSVIFSSSYVSQRFLSFVPSTGFISTSFPPWGPKLLSQTLNKSIVRQTQEKLPLIDGLLHPALFNVISPLATSLLLTWFPLQTLSSPAGVTRLPHGTASIFFPFKIQRKEIFHMPTFFQQKFILPRKIPGLHNTIS